MSTFSPGANPAPLTLALEVGGPTFGFSEMEGAAHAEGAVSAMVTMRNASSTAKRRLGPILPPRTRDRVTQIVAPMPFRGQLGKDRRARARLSPERKVRRQCPPL